MSKQLEINRILEAIGKDAIELHTNEDMIRFATLLFERGIRSKDGFELAESTKDIDEGNLIKPIDYKEDE